MMYQHQYKAALPIAVMRAGGRIEITRDQLANPPELVVSIDQAKNVWVLEAAWLEAQLMPGDPALEDRSGGHPLPSAQRGCWPPPPPASMRDAIDARQLGQIHDVEPEPVTEKAQNPAPEPIEPPPYLEKREKYANQPPKDPGITCYGHIIAWDDSRIEVSGLKTPGEAYQACLKMAQKSGFTPRKWWQIWRPEQINAPTVAYRRTTP